MWQKGIAGWSTQRATSVVRCFRDAINPPGRLLRPRVRTLCGVEDVDAVARGIKEFDNRHLFTAGSDPEFSAVDRYKAGGWLDLNSTYTYGIVHKKLLADYNRTPVMPYFLLETTYEGEHNASPVQIRRQAYWALLCGAAGQFFGNRPIWGFEHGWENALDSVAAQDMVRLKALFASRAWSELVPDQKHQFVIDGLGEFNGLAVQTCSLLVAAGDQEGFCKTNEARPPARLLLAGFQTALSVGLVC